MKRTGVMLAMVLALGMGAGEGPGLLYRGEGPTADHRRTRLILRAKRNPESGGL